MRPSVIVRCSAMECGSVSQPRGTTNFRQVSASEGTWWVPIRIVQILWVGHLTSLSADGPAGILLGPVRQPTGKPRRSRLEPLSAANLGDTTLRSFQSLWRCSTGGVGAAFADACTVYGMGQQQRGAG